MNDKIRITTVDARSDRIIDGTVCLRLRGVRKTLFGSKPITIHVDIQSKQWSAIIANVSMDPSNALALAVARHLHNCPTVDQCFAGKRLKHPDSEKSNNEEE